MEIVILDGYALNPGDLSYDELKQFGTLTVYDRTTPDQIIERIKNAEIVITNKTVINKNTIDNTNMKYIGVLATGFNVVDVNYANEKNILVTNIPDYSTKSVAQLTIGLLLEACHEIGNHNTCVKNGQWENSKDFTFWNSSLIELDKKTIGIIGYGKIGKEVGKLAKAFGMNVLPHANSLGEESISLDEIYEKSDIITLHCPLNEKTSNMINEISINKMKDRVIIINTARGGLIDEQAMYKALEDRKVYKLCADVVSVEPIKKDNPLLKTKHSILTPHIAWAPFETRQRLITIAINNVLQYTRGNPINVVH